MTSRTFGRFVVKGKVADHALGIRYRAQDVEEERPVELFAIHPRIAALPGFPERFFRAARAATQVDHPRVAGLYHAGREDGVLYLVHERVAGNGLDQLAARLQKRRERMPLVPLLKLLAQVAGTVDDIHEQGVFHGALAPEVICVRTGGSSGAEAGAQGPVVMALGLPTISLDDVQAAEERLLPLIPYLAPEQLLGGGASARSDVYSLGVILYTLTSGELPGPVPERAGDVKAYLERASQPVHTVRPDLPIRVAAVIQRAMSRNPDRRLRSAGQMARALQVVADDLQVGDSRHQEPTPVGSPATDETRGQESGEAGDAEAIAVEPAHVEVEPGTEATLQVDVVNNSPQTDHFTLDIKGIPRQWVSVPQEFVRLAPGAGASVPITIRVPQSSSAEAGDYDLRLAVAAGGQQEEVAAAHCRLTILPFSEIYMEMSPEEVSQGQTVSVSVRNDGNLAENVDVRGRDPADAIQFSGEKVGMTIPPGETVVVPIEVAAREQPLLGQGQVLPFRIVVSGEAGLELALEGQLDVSAAIPTWLITVLGVLLALSLVAVSFQWLSGLGPGPTRAVSVASSPSATTVPVVASPSAEAVVPPTPTVTVPPTATARQTAQEQAPTDVAETQTPDEGSTVDVATSTPPPSLTPTLVAGDDVPTAILTTPVLFAPIGDEEDVIAYQAGAADGAGTIRLVTRDGNDSRALVENAAAPVWSPDGGRLAFVRSTESSAELAQSTDLLHIVAADGNELGRIEIENGRLSGLTWSPDGERVAFNVSAADEAGRLSTFIAVADVDRSAVTRVTEEADGNSTAGPAWSPDGSQILYHGRQIAPDGGEGIGRLFLVAPDGSDRRPLLDEPSLDVLPGSYDWSPDAQQLVFSARDEAGAGDVALYQVGADGSGLQQLAAVEGIQYLDPRWSPDGTSILFLAREAGNEGSDVLSAAADGAERRQLTSDMAVYEAGWSPDGSEILLVADDDGDGIRQLFVMGADDAALAALTADLLQSSSAAWRP